MEPGFRSPLVDLFRRGEADHATRLVAAQGELGLRAHEQLALLLILVDDPDAEIARDAGASIAATGTAVLLSFLARAETTEPMRAYFAARGITRQGAKPASAAESVEPDLGAADEPEDVAAPEALDGAPAPAAPVLLSTLPIINRLKLATKGSRAQRAQLIRDSNRMVATAVLSSPKLNESEVEAFAKMGNVSEDVLRIIGSNRTWMKNYGVVHGLVRNPKTPPALSMTLLHRLNVRDVKSLASDRNVPEMVRQAAKRQVARSQP